VTLKLSANKKPRFLSDLVCARIYRRLSDGYWNMAVAPWLVC